MPKSTVEHEDEWKFPEDVPMAAVLKSVTEKSFPYKKDGRDEVFVKWEWEFDITDGEYAGLRGWGSTEPKVTSHPDNKSRQWYETLTGEPVNLGDGVDTDDVLGLPCLIVFGHDKRPKKGTTDEFFYDCPVKDVFPADADLEPPY